MDIGTPDPRFGMAGRGVPPFRDGTVRDAAAFRARLEAFQRHVQQKRHELFKRCLAEVLTGVVDANPVGNPTLWKKPRKGYVGGHSRRNWQVVTLPEALERPGADPGPGAANAASLEGYAAIARVPIGTNRMYIVNPVPYVERLNQGWSSQAPAGWIDAVLQRVIAKYRRVQ